MLHPPTKTHPPRVTLTDGRTWIPAILLACSQVLHGDGNESNASSYTSRVQRCVDILIQHGTDRYGEKHAPILVSILDVESRECPRNPEPLDEAFRVMRRDRRNPAGSNLYTDQATLRTMHALSAITRNNTYADFADSYAKYVMEHLVDEQGFFWWGMHRHYDVFDDSRKGHNPSRAKWGEMVFPHEIHSSTEINWQHLWSLNQTAVTRQIEAIWQWHVYDKKTGEINRHGDGNKGCDFPMSGGAYIEAFVFMFSQTKDAVWLDRAKLVANYFWGQRNPQTNLLPARPNAGNNRFDGTSCVTSLTGLYCHSLLKAYEVTGETNFRDQAIAYLKAYDKYAYAQKTGRYWGALELDGTPIPGPRKLDGYAMHEPRGYLDIWQPYIGGYQSTLSTAQNYVYAYQLTKDPALLVASKRFAEIIRKTPPGTAESSNTWYQAYTDGAGKQGAHAEKYGRAISFFLHLFAVTGEESYLKDARKLADESIERLDHNGIFRGHPAKPYYEAIDGVGNLLFALLQLDQVIKEPRQVTPSTVLASGETKVHLRFNNW